MQHNLTENQLKALRWLVQQVKNTFKRETFEVAYMAWEGGETLTVTEPERRKPPGYVNIGTLDALAVSGILIPVKLTRDTTRYTLTKRAYEIADFDFDNPDPWPKLAYIKETRRLIRQHFNREALSQVCFDLGVNPDWVFGEKTNWPHLLLVHLYEENKLKELTPVLKAMRQAVDWPEFPAGED